MRYSTPNAHAHATTQDSVRTTRRGKDDWRFVLGNNSRNPPHFRLMRTRGSTVATPSATSAPETVPALLDLEAYIIPRTVTGKIASATAVQRQQEFMDWQAALPPLLREDEERDDSYAAFMKQRRVRKEQQRWNERRRQQWADRGKMAPIESRHAVVEREFMQWEPRGKVQICFEDIGGSHEEMKQVGSASREGLRHEFERERDQERKRAAYAAKRDAIGVPVGEYAVRRREAKLGRKEARQQRRETREAKKREQELMQEAARQQQRHRPLTFDKALGSWGEELDTYEKDRRDDADEKFAMALGAWQAELDEYRDGLRDDRSETFEMALDTWGEQCEAEVRSEARAKRRSPVSRSIVAAASQRSMRMSPIRPSRGVVISYTVSYCNLVLLGTDLPD